MLVAARYRRHSIGIELNPEYVKMAASRIETEVSRPNFFRDPPKPFNRPRVKLL
jgi:DNA modification methylase